MPNWKMTFYGICTGIYDFEDERGIFRASVGGIDEYGQLILKDTDGRERVYAFKEVRYVC